MQAAEILDAPLDETEQAVYPLRLGGVIILIGMGIGLFINGIGGLVSPRFYEVALHLPGGASYPRILLQGVLEGALNGMIFALIYGMAYQLFTRNGANWSFLFKELKLVVLGVLACWIIGGMVGLIMEWSKSDVVIYPPMSIVSLEKDYGFAWVGSSILGAQVGGVVMALIGAIRLWRRKKS
ncbi:MAG: hypothetical protein AAF433_03280 [Bacteroidota bacterium]